MRMLLLVGWACAAGLLLQGCIHKIPVVPEDSTVQAHVAVGRVIAVLTGERSRIYQPAVRSIEIQNAETKERFMVEIESDNARFVLPLPPGTYELIRVQINEGAFLSMAHLASTFSIDQEPITYVGTWRFGVDSPKYGRMLSVSMISDEEDRAHAAGTLTHDEPSVDTPVRTALPDPPQVQARLFEVMPYPRVPRYFRRHWG